ncbi:hypothetical protein ACKFKG_03075 [Phormidesmis sp. 146-35]
MSLAICDQNYEFWKSREMVSSQKYDRPARIMDALRLLLASPGILTLNNVNSTKYAPTANSGTP